MSLNRKQIDITEEELKENFKNLNFGIDKILSDLQLTEPELDNLFTLGNADPGEVWKLRDYLEEKLKEQNLPYRPFSVLKPGSNKWFTYKRTWK